MNILVTGATGFIGSHLVKRLSREGHAITCVSKDSMHGRLLESLGCRVGLGDLNKGFSLYKRMAAAGFEPFVAGEPRSDRMMIEVHPHACYAALLGRRLPEGHARRAAAAAAAVVRRGL